ncbi:hypothetical protein PIB30_090829 [Stylosanthes scabra]|uniref:Uncharacterized protein n=1 Tax=Stylosanthes scabra TaxID=79078 RepID=A0ABU6ZT29_9FABA|nr:hypothetical protein [Stylosanthes scabra]
MLFVGSPGGEDLRMTIYLYNAVSRQFGLAQAIPSPYHPQRAQPLDVKASSTEELLNFQKDNAVRKSIFHLFSVETCMLTTQSFGSWWKAYYSAIKFPLSTCYKRITKTLVMHQVQRASNNQKTKKKLEPVDVTSNSDGGDTKDTSSTTESNEKQGELGQSSTVYLSQAVKQLTPAVDVEPITSTIIVDDLLSNLEVLSEAYACSMDANKEIVVKTSSITQFHSLINQSLDDSSASTTFDMSTLHSFGKKIIVDILSKPLSTLATDQVFKSQFADIIQIFMNTSQPETIRQLLARSQKFHNDLDVKFLES